MGTYDTFQDGDKEVQLNIFGCTFEVYTAGEFLGHILQTFNYPMTASFFCISDPTLFVHFKNGVFTGIDHILTTPLYDCGGQLHQDPLTADEFCNYNVRDSLDNIRANIDYLNGTIEDEEYISVDEIVGEMIGHLQKIQRFVASQKQKKGKEDAKN